MIRKILLYGVITLLTFTSYSQFKKNNGSEIKTSVTKFEISIDDLDELENIDWDGLKEAFKSNEKDELITISVAYNKNNNTKTNLTEEGEDNFKISGKSTNIDMQINNLQRILQKHTKKKEL